MCKCTIFNYFFNSDIIDIGSAGLRLTESEVNFMARNSKQTSRAVASKASKVLRDGRYSKTSKSVAGSALAQTKPKK